MKKLLLCIGLILLFASAGCMSATNPRPAAPGTIPGTTLRSEGTNMTVTSGGLAYPVYVGAPVGAGKYPGIVLMHSFNGLEPGYRTLVDRFSAEGYVVIAPQWQTFNKSPPDEDVGSLISASTAYLKSRPDVDSSELGLTGFCAGGRYTMLFLPQMKEFKSGVAWYGFPYNPGFASETKPVDHIGSLTAPMLMIHGSADQASPVTDIYNYSVALNQQQKYFELKVYEGQPHGFMIQNGSLNESDIGHSAFNEMVTFFDRTLKGRTMTRLSCD